MRKRKPYPPLTKSQYQARLESRDMPFDEENEIQKRINAGHFTGRCGLCGSSDLWDDNLHYGCNSCGTLLA